ncbi:hypothetical protein GTO89_03155 [Heliobacterium gestii]|uniref:Uncharacterized protein n=1 Tax=Heliomicrobium gestii TaxID=2699 RepID=A0A845LES2_HELGE|nr:hypothetical protein [Heliomicrobium gestii]MBM7865787.1 hypothetical protein [Heliomicrobium gestii]MZP42033.1 hypothetical protein [Heliomicrobium gestii]
MPLLFFSILGGIVGYSIGSTLGLPFVTITSLIGFSIPSVLVLDKVHKYLVEVKRMED